MGAQADQYLEDNMSDIMSSNGWGTVVDYRTVEVGYDLKLPTKRAPRKKPSVKPARKRQPSVIEKGDNQQVQMQKLIFNYFIDYDDKTVVEFINCFVYSEVNPRKEVSELLHKFLKDQDLELAYADYISDRRGDSKYWLKSNPSDIETINQIFHALLNISFNRLADIVL